MSWTTWAGNTPRQPPATDASCSLQPYGPGCRRGVPSLSELPPNKSCWFNFLLQLCKELCSNHMWVKNLTETVSTAAEYPQKPRSERARKTKQWSHGDRCVVRVVSRPSQWGFYCYIAKIKENLTCQRCTKFWCRSRVVSSKFKCYLTKYSSNRLLKSAVVQAEHVLTAVLGGTALLLVAVLNPKNLCSDPSWRK